MTAFIKDLASRALGLADLAEPVVTHRFAEFQDQIAGTADLSTLAEAPPWAPRMDQPVVDPSALAEGAE